MKSYVLVAVVALCGVAPLVHGACVDPPADGEVGKIAKWFRIVGCKLQESADNLEEQSKPLADKISNSAKELGSSLTQQYEEKWQPTLSKAVEQVESKAKEIFSGIGDFINNRKLIVVPESPYVSPDVVVVEVGHAKPSSPSSTTTTIKTTTEKPQTSQTTEAAVEEKTDAELGVWDIHENEISNDVDRVMIYNI